MPYQGPGDADYKCEGCGALYRITSHHVPMRDKDKEECSICGTTLVSWNGSRIYSARLIQPAPKSKHD